MKLDDPTRSRRWRGADFIRYLTHVSPKDRKEYVRDYHQTLVRERLRSGDHNPDVGLLPPMTAWLMTYEFLFGVHK